MSGRPIRNAPTEYAAGRESWAVAADSREGKFQNSEGYARKIKA